MISALATLLGAVAIYAGIMTYFYRSAVHACADFRADVAAAQEQNEEDRKAREIEYRNISKQTGDAWAAALAYSRSHPVVRVLRPDCHSGKGTSVSFASAGLDVGTAEPGLGREVVVAVEECETRLNNAAQDAAQVIVLQNWIKRVYEASK